jgi:hypothetical protein
MKELELFKAAEDGNINLVKSLINDKGNKIDINWKNPDYVRN